MIKVRFFFLRYFNLINFKFFKRKILRVQNSLQLSLIQKPTRWNPKNQTDNISLLHYPLIYMDSYPSALLQSNRRTVKHLNIAWLLHLNMISSQFLAAIHRRSMLNLYFLHMYQRCQHRFQNKMFQMANFVEIANCICCCILGR